jgi:hypothetical protein
VELHGLRVLSFVSIDISYLLKATIRTLPVSFVNIHIS